LITVFSGPRLLTVCEERVIRQLIGAVTGSEVNTVRIKDVDSKGVFGRTQENCEK
jgi:hypothetical protein